MTSDELLDHDGGGLLPLPTRAIVRRPSTAVADGLTTADLGAPDVERTAAQLAGYVEALRSAGVTVTELPAVDAHPDGHFVEDAAVLLGEDVAVLTRPGAPSRRQEPAALAPALPHPVVVHLGAVGGPDATLDGGDVLIAADRVLVGVSARTNRAGAEALRRIIAEHRPGWPVHLVPFTGVLHLKTGMTEVAPGTLLVSPQLHVDDDRGVEGLRRVLVPAPEAYAANVVRLASTTLVADGFPAVAALAAEHGPVTPVAMGELEKMDGGLTCLSLRW